MKLLVFVPNCCCLSARFQKERKLKTKLSDKNEVSMFDLYFSLICICKIIKTFSVEAEVIEGEIKCKFLNTTSKQLELNKTSNVRFFTAS